MWSILIHPTCFERIRKKGGRPNQYFDQFEKTLAGAATYGAQLKLIQNRFLFLLAIESKEGSYEH